MATLITNTKTQPAVEMNKLHVDSFTFSQERVDGSKRKIGASGVLYGYDADGKLVFDSETFGVSDTDIDTTIVLSAIAEGISPEQFMINYAAAKAEVNTEIENGTLNDAKLMAYFEAAFARIFELHGKINISGVE